jgi:hypothetical protein
MQAEYLLMFGVDTLQIQLPFTMPDYQVQQYDNCKIVMAPSLTDLNKKTSHAKSEKTKLWKSLQNVFSPLKNTYSYLLPIINIRLKRSVQ